MHGCPPDQPWVRYCASTEPKLQAFHQKTHKLNLSGLHKPKPATCHPTSLTKILLLLLNVNIFRILQIFLYVNMPVLNGSTSGAVHIHPRCHTRGLSVWRNSHTDLWVQSCFLWADSHRLSDQLITPEGWIPGNSFTDLSLCWRTDSQITMLKEPTKCEVRNVRHSVV